MKVPKLPQQNNVVHLRILSRVSDNTKPSLRVEILSYSLST